MKRTMTVAELIDELQRFDGDDPVIWQGTKGAEAIYTATRPDDADSVCALLSAGQLTDDDARDMAECSVGEYAAEIGL